MICIQRNIRNGDEETPFEKENARSRECKDRIAEDEEVRPYGAAELGREPRFYQHVCGHEKEEEEEGQDAGCPGEADGGEEAL